MRNIISLANCRLITIIRVIRVLIRVIRVEFFVYLR